jgi:hypothetical protein
VCLSAGNLPLVGLPAVTTSCDLFEVVFFVVDVMTCDFVEVEGHWMFFRLFKKKVVSLWVIKSDTNY